MRFLFNSFIICFISSLLISCERDIAIEIPIEPIPYNPTFVEFISPIGFPPANIPFDNPMTEEGILLGKKLFNDPILSVNNQQACVNCHLQEFSFTDPLQFSIGTSGSIGNRNSMALVNLAWGTSNFWDGSTSSLEEQALDPVTSPIELHSISWKQVIEELKDSEDYPDLFYKAFGVIDFDSTHVAKAIAQFERTLVSAQSKFDLYVQNQINLTNSELRGMEIYMTEKGDCFHCHSYPFMTNHDFHNNGLDSEPFADNGLGDFTGEQLDNGKFKTPTLRNIALTAPYMHDGRFATLEEVVEHYNSGGVESSTIDPLMKHVGEGLGLTSQDKSDLVNFMLTFTDTAFINNTIFHP